MKKNLVILTGVFVGIFIFLTLLDRSEYPVEKKLWAAKKQFEGISQDPKVVPEKKFADVIAQYERIIQQYPRSKLLSRIYLQIGRIYMLKGDYAKARTVFAELIQRFSQEPEFCAEALFNTGRTFELEVDFKNAVKTYRAVWQQYPKTEVGLAVPGYIANYCLYSGKQEEAQKFFAEAVGYYIQVAKDSGRSLEGYRALRFLASCYLAQQNWPAAVDTLARMLLDFPGPEYLQPQRLDVIIRSIDEISVTQLQDYERPQKIYQAFIDTYPKHPVNSILKETIAKLQQARSGTVVGSNQ